MVPVSITSKYAANAKQHLNVLEKRVKQLERGVRNPWVDSMVKAFGRGKSVSNYYQDYKDALEAKELRKGAECVSTGDVRRVDMRDHAQAQFEHWVQIAAGLSEYAPMPGSVLPMIYESAREAREHLGYSFDEVFELATLHAECNRLRYGIMEWESAGAFTDTADAIGLPVLGVSMASKNSDGRGDDTPLKYLVTLQDAAERLGLSRDALKVARHRNPDSFPEPIAHLGAMVWDFRVLEAWHAAHDKPGRPSKG